ncbi:MAG: aminotransferase class III-fold pyridoxal phosphate-dependent enzyme, partial [Clostridia bacterium]|nr:aminotransferase class III-fold pyridoxal phosphate-dependent enzyme [Clostridia bacterium]
GAYFKEKLNELKDNSDGKITEVRGEGLLIGIQLKDEIAKDTFKKLFNKGFLTSLCGCNTIRIAPPLILKKEEADLFVDALKGVL